MTPRRDLKCAQRCYRWQIGHIEAISNFNGYSRILRFRVDGNPAINPRTLHDRGINNVIGYPLDLTPRTDGPDWNAARTDAIRRPTA